MKIQKDIDFLHFQQTKDRSGCIMRVDMNLTQAKQRKYIRNENKIKKHIAHSDTLLTSNLLFIIFK